MIGQGLSHNLTKGRALPGCSRLFIFLAMVAIKRPDEIVMIEVMLISQPHLVVAAFKKTMISLTTWKTLPQYPHTAILAKS